MYLNSFKSKILKIYMNNNLFFWTLTWTFVFGMLISLYMFTNKLPNGDDLGQLWDPMVRNNSGRWFLFFPAAISSNFSLPLINGILGVLYISLSASIIVTLFQIKSKVSCFLVGAVMTAFPGISSTFTYMNSADAYFFSILLITIAVYVIDKFNYKFIGVLIGAILVCLSLGIYQAYFSFGISLCVIKIIKYSLTINFKIKVIIAKGFKYIATFGIGMVLYMVMADLTTESLTTYADIDTMGQISLSEIPMRIASAYTQFWEYFVGNTLFNHYLWQPISFIACSIICLLFVLLLITRVAKNDKIYRICISFACILLIPLSSSLIKLMTDGNIHALMIYGIVSVFIFIIAVSDWFASNIIYSASIRNYSGKLGSNKFLKIFEILNFVVIAIVTTFVFRYAVLSNSAYVQLDITLQQSYSYGTRLLSKIESVDDFDNTDTIVFIGTMKNDYVARETQWLAEDAFNSFTGTNQGRIINKTLYLNRYLGFENSFETVAFLQDQNIHNLNIIISDMPEYPDEGSVLRIDEDIIVVKFEDVLVE